MALKYQVDSLEGLPETLHEFYREDNGKFVLDAEGVKPMSEFEKVTNALSAERKTSKQYKDQASAWESRFTGKTIDEIAAQLERIPLLEAESQGKVDPAKHATILETTVKQRMAPLEHDITRLKQTVAEREQEIAAFKAADRKRTIHDAVRSLAAKEGFQEQSYSGPEGALLLLAERYLTINSVGDVVVSDDAKPYTPGLGLREALGELKQHHPYLLKPSVGGGAAGNGLGGNISNNPFKSNNKTDRIKFEKENGPEKTAAAMKAAGLKSFFDDYVAPR